MDLRTTTAAMDALVSNVARVITGKRSAVELAAVALFAGQHLLIEDVPGVGKTMLARAVAKSIDGSFKRIQGTSDLLPSDITGATVFDQGSRTFHFVPGPVFANVVLFDEINRTGPKTQSALLEVMDEASVSVDGNVYELPRPFFVAATRNPVEHHGTFPLPEGELDRFGVSLQLGYPDVEAERRVVVAQMVAHPLEELEPVISPDDVVAHQAAIRTVYVEESVLVYIVDIVRATRDRADVSLGASPRGSVSLTRVAQANAVLHGRDHVLPDDVKQTATAVLAHRILLSPDVAGGTEGTEHVVAEVLEALPVPVATFRSGH
jgi:MoxR-like ATPase